MAKQDETVETNNIMEEKTLSVLSDSAGIETVTSETTPPVISTESSSHDDKLLKVLESMQALQLKLVFSHFDESGDRKKLLELQRLEAIDELLEYDDSVKLVESRGNKKDEGNNYPKDAFQRFMDVQARNRQMRNHYHALFWRKVKADRENSLPLSRNDLKNVLLERKALNRKHFLPFAVESVLDISPQQHGVLLMSCGGLLSYLAKNSTTPFEFRFGKTTDTPVPSLLSFEDAVFAFFPEMAHMALFMIFYILTWMLVLPLRFGVQMFFMLLLISAPFFYFPELVRKASASGVHVACGGSFKLPLIGFSTLGAFGITFAFGLVALLVFYLIWRFVYGRKPTRGKDIEVSSDDLLSLISNV
ncbi:uncharacterized protein LOC127126924 isoform X2 [Lathyrus oleraceus]|uniref:uncharacterized protein LOC127126924 isoform X2 n=1 Tax=Pisum sativum TaxID=3888 RepID=UPI0021D0E894|nr:uncharacterized protein LOC127126924 isoform X2 [Pisum sativum]